MGLEKLMFLITYLYMCHRPKKSMLWVKHNYPYSIGEYKSINACWVYINVLKDKYLTIRAGHDPSGGQGDGMLFVCNQNRA